MATNKLLLVAQVPQMAWWLSHRKVEVVNTHSSRDGWFVGLAARLARIPLVIRSRHIDISYRNPYFSRLPFTWLADHVVCTSSDIQNHLTQCFRLPPDRITTIATGIDIHRFSPNKEASEQVFKNSSPGIPRIGIVSVIRSWKGHETLIRAFRMLLDEGRKLQLYIVGDGPSRGRFEELVEELGLSDFTTFSGYVEEVPSVLRGLDVLVIPSISHEGIPQIGLQALACQTPVVGSDFGGIPEVIRHDQTGTIFPRGDVQALADSLRRVLEEPDRTRDLALAGRKFVEQEHSLSRMVERTEDVYRKYLGS